MGGKKVQRDLLVALVGRLREIFGDECAVFYGRVLQGQREPCFYLRPQAVERRVLTGGRVWRRVALELHYYPLLAGSLDEQAEVGEKLLRGLVCIDGEQRAYRGQEMAYRVGSEYLCWSAAYEYHTTAEQEAADSGGSELMEVLVQQTAGDHNDK